MATVEERLKALEDKREVLRTLHVYGHSLDYGDEAGFMDCWTEDASLGWSMFPEPLCGHARIRAGFHRHTHAPGFWHKHLLAEPQITVEGDVARVTSMFFRLDPYESTGAPEIYAFGRYEDTLVRCADGRWRFTERIVKKEAARITAGPSQDDQHRSAQRGGSL
jgi:ketosteroid isomerase-like protein